MRIYKRKTENGLTPTTVVIEEAKHVIDGKVTSIRATARKFGIHYSTLSRYINKARKLAFECAVKYSIKFPQSWFKLSMATSLARATSFNHANVGVFFQKLSDVVDRHHFSASNI